MKGRVLIIGAGGVGTVVAQKVAMNRDIFTDITIASRTKSTIDALVAKIPGGKDFIKTAQVDADDVEQLCVLMERVQPELVINVALPYQDLPIMDACLRCGVNYLDTANYEPKDEAKYEYSWQWAYQDRFKEAGLTAILGCGFDPGVCSVYTAYAAKHHFDEITHLDIVDCNAGDHHKAFATNFNPEINIREVTQHGRYYEDGKWITTEPLEIHKTLTYPEVGPRESYLMYHEELESLVKNYPSLCRAGEEEDRVESEVAQVCLRHLPLSLHISHGADAADEYRRTHPPGVVSSEPLVGGDGDARLIRIEPGDLLHPLLGCGVVLLADIDAHEDVQLIDDAKGAADEIVVTYREGVKGAGEEADQWLTHQTSSVSRFSTMKSCRSRLLVPM